MEARARVLVVEDDDDLRTMLCLSLSVDGFDVDEARTGYEALRFLDSHVPDLVVLDLGLPGISGLSVQQEIAAHAVTRHIPVVIVTGSSKDLSHLDVECVLRKPVTPDELIATVRRCLVKGAPGAGA